MPRFNTIIEIIDPSAGRVAWQWSLKARGRPTDFAENPRTFVLASPLMRIGSGNPQAASSTLAQPIDPANILDLFRLATPPTPIPRSQRGRSDATWYPIDGFWITRYDENNRDAALIFPNLGMVDYVIKTKFQRLPTITLEVTWHVTQIRARTGVSGTDYYEFDATPSPNGDDGNPILPVWDVNGESTDPVQTDNYFDGDPVIFTQIPQQPDSERFMLQVYGEILNTDSGFDVTIAGDGPVDSTETTDIRVRFNQMIEAGMSAIVDGKSYTIVGTDIEERYKYMRLSLSRNVT